MLQKFLGGMQCWSVGTAEKGYFLLLLIGLEKTGQTTLQLLHLAGLTNLKKLQKIGRMNTTQISNKTRQVENLSQ